MKKLRLVISILILVLTIGCGDNSTKDTVELVDKDTTPPVITLNGARTITLTQGTTYVEAGASATDNVDGTLNVTTTGMVDVSLPNTYTITYTATDSANNSSTETRIVIVELLDVTPPVITLNGSDTITLMQGADYVEAGASAIDNVDGILTVTTSGAVDINIPNTYTITYTATDSANNMTTASRTVIVVVLDTTPPMITLNGASTITIVQGSAYVEAGANATDNVDGTLDVTTTGMVDVNTPNTYTITYTATDSANNTATATRIVNVEVLDVTPPLITLNGAATITLLQGNDYVEAGASAFDDVDGNVNVMTGGAVDINVPNTYTITYTATDSANNTSTSTRIVIIELNATYTLNPTSGVVASAVNFTASQTSNILSYAWDFGDGTTASGATTSHTYNQAGSYTTSLTVVGSAGGRATTSQDFVVSTSPGDNPIIIPDNVYFFDDFEYNVTRDSGNSVVNQTAFQNAGWNGAKAINTTGSHNGYLYTVDSIPGYTGLFPGSGSNKVLAIEGRAGTFGSQTDFYLQFGNETSSIETLPGNLWYQFWIYTNDFGDQRSRFSNRDKLIYPCRTTYPCPSNLYLLYAGSGENPPYWTDSLNGPGVPQRYFMLYDNHVTPQMALDDGTPAKLGHNLNTYHLVPNQWQLVKLHFDTSTPQGTFEVWIKPMGGSFIKVAEWIHGQNGFTWNIADPGGHSSVRIPTTLPGANNTQFYDSWVYLDDFSMATSEDALPQYPH